MRDNFSQKTKDILARRVAHVCSNPDCRKRTIGPGSQPDETVNIGVAAHITAASPGGARYDPFMSKEERTSPENGIWLCQNCARLIDADPESYPVETLMRWKAQTEKEAQASIGRRFSLESKRTQTLMEAEDIAADALEYLRYCIKQDDSRLLRNVDLLPNKNVAYGIASPSFTIYYESQPELVLQFQWLCEEGFLTSLNDRVQTPRYRIPNNIYRWLLATA